MDLRGAFAGPGIPRLPLGPGRGILHLPSGPGRGILRLPSGPLLPNGRNPFVTFVTQYVVRFGYLFKLCLCTGRIVLVRKIPKCYFAIRLLNRFWNGIAADSKNT